MAAATTATVRPRCHPASATPGAPPVRVAASSTSAHSAIAGRGSGVSSQPKLPIRPAA